MTQYVIAKATRSQDGDILHHHPYDTENAPETLYELLRAATYPTREHAAFAAQQASKHNPVGFVVCLLADWKYTFDDETLGFKPGDHVRISPKYCEVSTKFHPDTVYTIVGFSESSSYGSGPMVFLEDVRDDQSQNAIGVAHLVRIEGSD